MRDVIIMSLVSVIVPTYNRASLLTQSIDSLLAQTYPNIELIVVNDGSTDNTNEVIRPYLDKVIYVTKNNGGCGDAKNTGIRVATGEYITHLDDDDLMMPTRIERLVQFLKQNTQAGLVATSAEFIDKSGNVTGLKPLSAVPSRTRLLHLLLGHLAVQSNMMMPSKVFEEVGPYVTHRFEDLDLWWKILRKYEVVAIKEPLVQYRKHDNQITSYANHSRNMAILKRMYLDFILLTPIDELIFGLQDEPIGRAILASLLARHKCWKEARRQLERVTDEGTKSLWYAMIILYHRKFDLTREHLEKVPASHPCHQHIPEVLDAIEKTVLLHEKYVGGNKHEVNMKQDVIEMRRMLQRAHLKMFNETLLMATRGQICLKD